MNAANPSGSATSYNTVTPAESMMNTQEFESNQLAVDIQSQLHFDTQLVEFAQCTTSCTYEAITDQSIRKEATKLAAPDFDKERRLWSASANMRSKQSSKG